VPEQSLRLNMAAGALFCEELLGDVPRGALSAFEAVEVKSSYPLGTTLFTEGEAPAGLFVICQGEAKLSISGVKTQQVTLRTARAGEILGLSATVSGEPYEVTAETTVACEVGFVARDDFIRFLRDHPEVTFRVVQVLSRDLNAIFDHGLR
jgi:CRP/FNR family transcriptional regulator, cyclic AMP receptor protein